VTNIRTISNSLPAPVGNSVVIEENQSVYDIMGLIAYMHKKNAKYYDKIAGNFWGGDVDSTSANLWEFCKKNIPYEVETEERQTVKSPQRILSDASRGIGHDCKHYASFIGGVLDALKRQGYSINWTYRFASYKAFDSIPGHVFVVVKDGSNEIWIDPVLDYFDEHRPYTFHLDRKISVGKSAIGATVGADNKTAATLKTIGGTICAVAPTVAAVVPIGTVIAGLAEVAGFATSFIGGLFQSKYAYSSQVDWLCVYYQRMVLGDPNAHGDHITTGLKEQYVPAAQMWFAAVFGIPCWDMLRFHALQGSDPNTGRTMNQTLAQRVAAYQAFGSIENNVPVSAIEAACKISDGMDAVDWNVGIWANYPPANIVLQQEGVTAEQAVEQAEGVLTGSNPGSVPSTTIFTSLSGSNIMVPLIIAGAALLLIANE
jgi:hypothetical protein